MIAGIPGLIVASEAGRGQPEIAARSVLGGVDTAFFRSRRRL